MNAVLTSPVENPFALEQTEAYLRWRERKLVATPRRAEELVVEVRDPRALTDSEVDKLRRVCATANMAVYSSSLGSLADKDIVRRIGARLGLHRLQTNPFADEDGISALETAPEKSARGYIPYSNRRLLWHTDGYYNPPAQRIRAFILHCVRPAAAGGENRLLDPEIAYLLLRDADPEHVRALSASDAMTIPANTDEGMTPRPAQSGPVFSSDAGALHMRYTARTRSIAWRSDAATRAAVERLRQILETASPYVFTLRLAPGQGLVCNNVLHDRSAFTDVPGAGRLVYRARYAERIAAP
ncbi:MAG: TauD/TfdA family dioxygenase [Betaproteobacteria bacterium]|nr:TauD/TfdA family dioxygenase [Betaproteobacteria bacterium]